MLLQWPITWNYTERSVALTQTVLASTSPTSRLASHNTRKQFPAFLSSHFSLVANKLHFTTHRRRRGFTAPSQTITGSAHHHRHPYALFRLSAFFPRSFRPSLQPRRPTAALRFISSWFLSSRRPSFKPLPTRRPDMPSGAGQLANRSSYSPLA